MLVLKCKNNVPRIKFMWPDLRKEKEILVWTTAYLSLVVHKTTIHGLEI